MTKNTSLVINLERINARKLMAPSSQELLAKLFATYPDCPYFSNHKEYVLTEGSVRVTHNILRRQRVKGLGYRYEVISDRRLGGGKYGSVHSIMRTLQYENGQVIPKQLPQKQRVVKVSKYFKESYAFYAKRDAAFGRKMSYLHAKPLVEADQTGYLVMRRLPGETLLSVIEKDQLAYKPQEDKRNRLTIEQRLKLSIALYKALLMVHDQGVIHRDIKPDNIIITKNNEVNFIDFGLSKDVREDDRRACPGNNTYKCPLVTMGLGSGFATDLYSLTMVLMDLWGAAIPDNIIYDDNKAILQCQLLFTAAARELHPERGFNNIGAQIYTLFRGLVSDINQMTKANIVEVCKAFEFMLDTINKHKRLVAGISSHQTLLFAPVKITASELLELETQLQGHSIFTPSLMG